MPAPNDTPIACTLTPADLRRRLDGIRRLTADHLLSHTLRDADLRLVYRARAWQALEAIVMAERQCCAFLDFDLRRTADGVELVISAPAHLGVEAHWLFEHFLPQTEQSTTRTTCRCSAGSCG